MQKKSVARLTNESLVVKEYPTISCVFSAAGENNSLVYFQLNVMMMMRMMTVMMNYDENKMAQWSIRGEKGQFFTCSNILFLMMMI